MKARRIAACHVTRFAGSHLCFARCSSCFEDCSMIMANLLYSGTLKTHTNVHAVRGRPTLKDVEPQFRNGSFRELKENAKITRKITRGTQRNSEEKTNTNSLVNRNLIDDYSDERYSENTPNNKHMESFKITNVFPETRRLGLKSVEMMISFLIYKLVLLFTILTIFNSSLSFVQLSVASVLIAASCMVLVVQPFINVSTNSLVNSLHNDCDLFDKAVQLSVFIHANKESHLLKECRSRYAKFLTHKYVDHKPCVVSRDREPSRIPVKQLTRLFFFAQKQKSVSKYVVENVPM